MGVKDIKKEIEKAVLQSEGLDSMKKDEKKAFLKNTKRILDDLGGQPFSSDLLACRQKALPLMELL